MANRKMGRRRRRLHGEQCGSPADGYTIVHKQRHSSRETWTNERWCLEIHTDGFFFSLFLRGMGGGDGARMSSGTQPNYGSTNGYDATYAQDTTI